MTPSAHAERRGETTNRVVAHFTSPSDIIALGLLALGATPLCFFPLLLWPRLGLAVPAAAMAITVIVAVYLRWFAPMSLRDMTLGFAFLFWVGPILLGSTAAAFPALLATGDGLDDPAAKRWAVLAAGAYFVVMSAGMLGRWWWRARRAPPLDATIAAIVDSAAGTWRETDQSERPHTETPGRSLVLAALLGLSYPLAVLAPATHRTIGVVLVAFGAPLLFGAMLVVAIRSVDIWMIHARLRAVERRLGARLRYADASAIDRARRAPLWPAPAGDR